MKNLIGLSVLISFLLLGHAQAEQSGQALKKGQIEALVKGNTVEGEKTREAYGTVYEQIIIPFQTYYRDDGVAIQRGLGGGDMHGITTEGK
jgi:hypothetical protein